MIQLPYFLLPVAGDTPLNSVIFQMIIRSIYTYLSQLYAVMPSGGLVDQVLCKSGTVLSWGTYILTDEKVKVTSSSVAGYFAEVIDTATLEVYNNKVRLYGGVPNFLGLTDTPSTYTSSANNVLRVASTEDKLEFVSYAGSIPTGVIAMWSGSAASVPSGWVICNGTTKYDGTNYTPNLTDYFVIGAGSSYSAPTLNTTTHTWVPGSSTTGGASTITLSSAQLPYHRHKASTFVSGLSGSVAYEAGDGAKSYMDGSITLNWAAVGSGGSFSILPPYYTLIFIMKTSS